VSAEAKRECRHLSAAVIESRLHLSDAGNFHLSAGLDDSTFHLLSAALGGGSVHLLFALGWGSLDWSAALTEDSEPV